MTEKRRRYERGDAELPCRLFIPQGDDTDELKFEAFPTTRNLGLGGGSRESTFLLKPGLELCVGLHLPNASLVVTGRVAHVVGDEDPVLPSGIGIEFLDMDSDGRETLMRDFTPPRYLSFFDAMTDELPHVQETFALEDVSLLLNLWEEWKVVTAGGPSATESGAPAPTPKKRKRRS